MKILLGSIQLLILLIPLFGKSYLGDTHLSDQKVDEITIMGCATLDAIVTKYMSIAGSVNASNITVDYFTVTGPVTVNKGLIKKGIITGSVVFNNVTSDNINIVGPLNGDHLNVAETFEIIGTLNAQNSRFTKMTLTMSESSIKDSKVSELIVRKTDSERKPQRLKLYGDTYINHIIFESDHGEIHVYGHSVKLLKVAGAKVIQH